MIHSPDIIGNTPILTPNFQIPLALSRFICWCHKSLIFLQKYNISATFGRSRFAGVPSAVLLASLRGAASLTNAAALRYHYKFVFHITT